MFEMNTPFGIIYCCNKSEARAAWEKQPEKRGRLWLEEEVTLYLLEDYDTVKQAVESKANNHKLILTAAH